jgi:hypothetical protein
MFAVWEYNQFSRRLTAEQQNPRTMTFEQFAIGGVQDGLGVVTK